MTTNRDGLKDMLYEAQGHLYDAIDLLDTYVRETSDIEADNYLVAQLKILASHQHGYLSSDLNIDDLLVDEYEADEEE